MGSIYIFRGKGASGKAKDFFDSINDSMSRKWENGSKRIKEIGIEAYFEETKNISHYIE